VLIDVVVKMHSNRCLIRQYDRVLRRAFEFQKRLLQEIAQLQGNMLVVLDREMRTIYVNRRMAEFLGVDPERPRDPRTHRIFWQSLWGDAAKEATLKALGLGLGAMALYDIEVVREPSGRPTLCLHGSAALTATEAGVGRWVLTLSHTGRVAQATVVAL
jgi:holo-[acyl-carrier protein] synthase